MRQSSRICLELQTFSAPGDTSYHLAGETVADGLDRILASVYDGNPTLCVGILDRFPARLRERPERPNQASPFH